MANHYRLVTRTTLIILLAVAMLVLLPAGQASADVDPSQVDQFQHQAAVPAGPFSVVSTASGTLTTTIPLFSWKTRGGMQLGVTLSNSHGSQLSGAGAPANGWKHNYLQFVCKWPNQNFWQWCTPSYARNWTTVGTTTYERCPGNPDDLATMTGGYEVTAKDQTRYQFTQNGYLAWEYLSKIIDTHNNQVSITYRTDNTILPTKVTDPSGRYIQFNWYNQDYLWRLTSVKDARSQTYGFEYTDTRNSALLTKINFPTPGAPSSNPQSYVEFTYELHGDNIWRIKTISVPGYNGSPATKLTWTYTYDLVAGRGYRILRVDGPSATQGRNTTSATPTKITFEYPDFPASNVVVAGKTYIQTIVKDALWTSTAPEKHREVHLYDAGDGYDGSDWDYYFGRMLGYVVRSQITDSPGSTFESDLTTRYPGCYYEKYTWDKGNNGFFPATRFDGMIQSYKDANSKIWQYKWYSDALSTTDNRLNLWKMTDPLNQSTKYEYDSTDIALSKRHSRMSKQIDPLNHTTYYKYHSTTYDLLETHADYTGVNLTTTNTYDSYGNPQRVTDPYGNQVEYQYDTAYDAYVTRETNLQTGVYTESGGYDAMGNRGWSRSPRRPTDSTYLQTAYEYDYVNQLGKILNPDGTYSRIWRDAHGNEKEITDEEGNDVRMKYDNLGHLREKTTFPDTLACGFTGPSSSDGWQISYCYDELGALKWLDWEDGTITYKYDEGNRLIQEILPGTKPGWYKYKYDGTGKVIQRIEGEGSGYSEDTYRTLDFTFDDAGRANQDKLGATVLVDRDYYNDGQISKVTNPNGYVEYFYDGAHRAIACYQSVPNKTLHYVYQVDNRPGYSHTTDANVYNGRYTGVGAPPTVLGSFSREFADGGNMVTLSSPPGDAAGPKTQFEYNTYGGLLSKVIYDVRGGSPFKAPYTTCAYDTTANKRLWLQDMVNYRSDGSIISRFLYEHDDIGNRTKITEANGDYTQYTYDDVSRLKSETRKASSGSQIYSYCYAYDLAGNREAKVLNNSYGTQTFNANYSGSENNLLTSISGAASCTFSYDDYGNLSQRITGGETWQYAYEGADGTLGLLTRVTRTDTTPDIVISSFKYDGLKHRVEKTDRSGVTRRYVYDGEGMIAETDANNNVIAWYTPGICVSRNVGGEWKTWYYHVDGLGTTREVTDGLQRVTDAYTYNAWGEEHAHLRAPDDPGKPDNPLRYNGKSGYYSDDDTGLVLLGVRYYDPLIGRFVSPDPSRDGLNWYAYADNNPLGNVDPDGLRAGRVNPGGMFNKPDYYGQQLQDAWKADKDLVVVNDRGWSSYLMANSAVIGGIRDRLDSTSEGLAINQSVPVSLNTTVGLGSADSNTGYDLLGVVSLKMTGTIKMVGRDHYRADVKITVADTMNLHGDAYLTDKIRVGIVWLLGHDPKKSPEFSAEWSQSFDMGRGYDWRPFCGGGTSPAPTLNYLFGLSGGAH